jgi:mRNA-degrading endonuclease RelE of RelBE toxin-antitoxin system
VAAAPRYRLELSRSAEKELEKLDKSIRLRVADALDNL